MSDYMKMVKKTSLVIFLFALAACDTTEQTAQKEAINLDEADPYIWLEEVEGQKALDTVDRWNEGTFERLKTSDYYNALYDEALAIATSNDRIAYGTQYGDYIYNFWRDEENVRGVWRRTSVENYMSPDVEWENLLSIDELAETEKANWVYKGINCLQPAYEKCLIQLSDGGKDASTYREWNKTTKSFVEDGFIIPEAKGGSTWADDDTIYLTSDWGEGSLTTSGYPFIIKRLERGQALSQAEEVYRGEENDMLASISSITLDDEQKFLLINRLITIFESEYYWLKEGETAIKLPLPRQSSITAYFKGQLIINLKQPWTSPVNGETFAAGAIVSLDLGKWMANQDDLDLKVVYSPDGRTTINGVSASKSKLILSVYKNVIGQALAFDYQNGAWTSTAIDLPDNGSIRTVSSNRSSDLVMMSYTNFLEPGALYALDMATGDKQKIKSSPAKFDAQNLTVEQHHSVSSDGEKIPYFIVRSKDTRFDGTNPTIISAYGGFQISRLPNYSGITGKLWMEKGGVYVLANIRGGGEFGPAWHQAGLKTKRQTIYDDMISVAEDLIERKVTSPRHLGIVGGSNGGLLTGVMYAQRPDLWNAVISAVPLLDMIRFDKLLAGASWIGEYGDPGIPEERAFLRKISPYHNVDANGTYPDIFFVTSTKDDRVHPAHARKMAALLEHYGHNFYYYENKDGGHSAAANLKETANRQALQYTFFHMKLK